MTTDSSMNDVDSANGDVMVSTDLTGRGTPTIYLCSLATTRPRDWNTQPKCY